VITMRSQRATRTMIEAPIAGRRLAIAAKTTPAEPRETPRVKPPRPVFSVGGSLQSDRCARCWLVKRSVRHVCSLLHQTLSYCIWVGDSHRLLRLAKLPLLSIGSV
jgi:hypothetical protein